MVSIPIARSRKQSTYAAGSFSILSKSTLNRGFLARKASLAFRGEFRKPCTTNKLGRLAADSTPGRRQDQKPARLQM
jgi:hypothetical protein